MACEMGEAIPNLAGSTLLTVDHLIKNRLPGKLSVGSPLPGERIHRSARQRS
jgi:hypothetical protein